jgi:AbrB family looped-hinge helix DNA binding protein
MQATLTSKGQVTIPKDVRDAMKLRTGDRVDFVMGEDGVVRILALTRSVKDLKGMLPKPARAVTLDAMDDAIARGARRA